MLRLKATKTSLYKLVGCFIDLPKMRRTNYFKAFRQQHFYLKWTQEDGYAMAAFMEGFGRPILQIAVHDVDGNQISRRTYGLAIADLRERDMIVEVAKRGSN